METWAAVVRVSHMGDRHAGADTFHSDAEQVDEIKRYAESFGQPVEIVWLAPELDLSGGLPIEKRPSLKAAIEGVETGLYTGIVCAYLKRLTRSRSGHMIWERVEAAGGRVHCARERTDTTTAFGRKIRDNAITDAVHEREEHGERSADRRRKTVEAGVWRQRQVPAGYQFAGPAVDGRYRGKARRLVPEPRSADAVRRAFVARAQGASLAEIARMLGYGTGGARALLKNRVYLGELRDGNNVNPAAHEPLVTPEQFAAAQRDMPRPARTIGDAPALLAGLVRCAGCGYVMSRRRTTTLVYGCHIDHPGGRCPRPASITCAKLDAHVEEIALVELERLAVSSGEGRGIEQAEAAVIVAENEIAALLKTVSAAGLDERDFAGELRDRKAALDKTRDQLAGERDRAPVLPIAGMTGADVWGSLTGHERNQLLRGLLSAVMVRAAGAGKRVPIVERVRVLRHGADPVWIDVDHPDALRLPAGEDGA